MTFQFTPAIPAGFSAFCPDNPGHMRPVIISTFEDRIVSYGKVPTVDIVHVAIAIIVDAVRGIK